MLVASLSNKRKKKQEKALWAWETLKGVAALGNRYLLEPQSIGSCVSTLLFRGFGVLRLDHCSDARAGARAGARTGARVHGVLIRYFPPRICGDPIKRCQD